MSAINQRLRGARDLFREALRSEPERDYTRLPVRRAMILLAIPMMAEMMMESVFAVVDIFFVARIGPEAVAAVGLTEAMLTLIIAVAIGLAMATTAMVARRIGEKDETGAAVASAQALWMGLIVAVVTGTIAVIFAPDLLRLMGASEAVIRDGAGYTAMLMGGSITLVYLFLINAIFRGAGDAAIAMRILWFANGLNCVLDPLLIFGIGPFPEMGVTGAAVATTIGRGAGVLYGLWWLYGGRSRIRLGLSHLKPVPQVMLRLARLSMGGIVQFLIATSSWLILMSIVARFGSQAVAGYTIAIRIIIFTLLPAWGLGNAAATLVGQHLGAGYPRRAEQSVWVACRYNFLFLVATGLVFILAAPWLIGLFTTDPVVLDFGTAALRVIAYGYGFYAVGMIVVQAFNGAGDTDTPMFINLCCYWLLQIPLAYALAELMGLGPHGVFWAVMSAEVMLTAVSVYVFRRGAWKLRTV